MSWARNIQSRIQQQQEFQKGGVVSTNETKPTVGSTSPSLTPLSSITSPLKNSSGNIGGSGPSISINSPSITATATSSQIKVTTGNTSFTTSSSLQAAASGHNNNNNVSPPQSSVSTASTTSTVTTTTTTTTTSLSSSSITSPMVMSTGIPNPNVKPSSIPSPSQSPMQTRNTSAAAPPLLSTPTSSVSSGLSVASSTSTAAAPPTPTQPRSSPYQFPNKIQPKSLTVDMFKGTGFSQVSFVEDLTRKLVNDQMGVDGIRFEPSPFNSLFLNTQLQLSQLENNIDRKLDDLAEECNDFSADYKLKLQDLLGKYQECFQHFKKLEKGVNTIGTKAVHFGDELDSVNQQKVKAQGALSLINYLLELNRAKEEGAKRSDIFTNSERIHELANLVKKLSSVSEDIKEISGFKEGKDEAETISNTLENDLINQFERAAERNDQEKMKQCASTLYNFNGGERCRARYIQKLKMFFDIDSLRKDENLANNTTKRQVRGNNIVDSRFEIFYTDILKDIAHEQGVIQNVFVNQASAMAMLIVRVFEQRVRLFVESVLALEANNVNMFLQTVHYAFNSTKKLLVDPLSSYGINGVDLNQLLYSIFCTYQEEYIQKESTYLLGLFEYSVVEECERLQQLDKYSVYNEDGLNPEITQMFVQQTENALTRSYTLSPDTMLADNIKTIFFLMLEYLFEKYTTFVLDKYVVLPLVSTTSSKGLLDAISQLFRVILSVNQIVGQIQTMFQVFVLPPIQTSMIVQSQCSDQLYYNISALENSINTGLENSLFSMIQLIEKALVDQKKLDFMAEDNYNTTPTCSAVVKLIQSFYDMAKTNLQGKNFNIFVEVLGLKVQESLLNHFKKFKIGQGIGALKLMSDLTEYKALSKLFKSNKVDDAFETLYEISKLHVINPETFRMVIEGGVLNRIPKQDLITLIKQRSDFKSIWLDTL